MERLLKTLAVLLFAVLIAANTTEANSRLQDVRIPQKKTNQLVVSFSAPVILTDATGFRLIGGASRIARLLSGSGTTELTFELTDYVLPDDRFEFLYWSELGGARVGSEKLASVSKISVDNEARAYLGAGRLFYVSTAGSDTNSGTSKDRPFRTIDRAQSVVRPGDYILIKRGDIFKNTFIDVKKSGSLGKYITFATYGSGSKPVIEHDYKNTCSIADRNYVQIDNLHFKTNGSGETGVYIVGNTNYPIVSNCRIEGKGKPHYGVNYGIKDGAAKKVVYPQVLNNYITGFRWNIRSSGYPYDGTHEVVGGLIENNRCADNRAISDGDGISAQRGKYHGLIIRKNEIYGYYDDGIDLFSAEDVIAEYNVIHDPQQPCTSCQGIKAGGFTRSEIVNQHGSTNITIRYNTVYNLYNRASSSGSSHGIQTNSGATGKIYGNVVHDVQGHGIIVSGPISQWEVHHNTVINAGEDGLQLYTEGPKGGNVIIRNNILEGKSSDLRCIIRGGGKKALGQRNILLGKGSSGHYEGRNDLRGKKDAMFVDAKNDDYRLKTGAIAVNAGVTVKEYTLTRRGLAINGGYDIGAFELAGVAPAPAPSPAPAPAPEPSPAPAPSPSPSPTPGREEAWLDGVEVKNPVNGVNYQYYEGSYQKLPDFSALPVVKQGKAISIDLKPRKRDDDFGFVFTGYFKAAQAGVYTFYTTSDDGSQLFIGTQRVVDNDGMRPAVEKSGSIGLKAGYHPIRVTYFEGFGNEMLRVQVKYASDSKRDLRANDLFLEGETRPAPEPSPAPAPSPSPSPTPGPEVSKGLNYQYYEGEWNKLPEFSALVVKKKGRVLNFDLSVRQREEYFGILYFGEIQIDQAGDYTFYTKSDDGSTLYIDGKQVVDNDGLHSPRERSGKIGLSVGRHAIEVRFFEKRIGQVLEVSYEAAGLKKQRVPQSKLYPADRYQIAAIPGLRYTYYEGQWSNIPNFASLKALKKGVVPNVSLSPSQRDRYFGFVFDGYIKIERKGEYTFYTTSDDGSQLYINGQQIVNNDGMHPIRERSGKVLLGVGYHQIEVRYFENAYAEKLAMSYQGPGMSKREIPDAVLFLERPSVAKSAAEARAKSGEAAPASLINEQGSVSIYPNPSQGMVNIRMNAQQEPVTIQLMNLTGHVLYERVILNTLLTQEIPISLSALSLKSGVYLISVQGAKVGSHTHRLVRE